MRSQNFPNKYCPFEVTGDYYIKVVGLNKRCRYHRKKGQEYSLEQISPQGLCPAFFQRAYPFCLSLLYNGHGGKISIKCPNKKYGLELEVYKKCFWPKISIMVKNKILKLIAKVCRPLDIPNENIYLKIVKTNTQCPKDYPLNKIFRFNIWNTNEICPAGFAQIFPYLFNLKEKEARTIPCPDDEVVTYEIKKR